MRRAKTNRAAAGAALALVIAVLVPGSPARAEIVVRLEVTAERAPVHLEPDDRSPVVETLARGALLKQASAMKFRTSWLYVAFQSTRSGRTLTGYVPETIVRKLNTTLKIIDLTPVEPEIENPRDLDLNRVTLPRVAWGQTEDGIMKAEGRPLSREDSGDMQFLRYHRDVLGKRCLVTYVLVDRHLASVRLRLLERYADKDRYVADYNRLREFMNARVGEPRFNNVVWKDRAYAERGEKLGTAVASGSLALSSEWVYQGTGLRLSLSGENSEALFAAEINDLKAKNPASF